MAKSILLAPIVPGLLALGLWLMRVPLHWHDWKTYVGLAIVSLAASLA